ncbi:alpha-galactosidase [Asanoa ishikariensis]|uniref:alpha-galactosidase n=1 Tax=Asanoa ishikariensis TaxID=137265 RepID=A0A1H3LMK6_9ACTN|nr:alpha-galactosidase [Asanoa ishikariensis]GIF65563.1 alpha-galactosidase [Asanoa ishikariensis]SDY65359.1 alpha-galactosidase [Asanoa ishikariensis]
MTEPVVLAAAGAALILDLAGPGLPRVVHWGADPGPLDDAALRALVTAAGGDLASAVEGPTQPVGSMPLLPTQWDGYAGRPGVTGDRSGQWPYLRLALDGPVSVSEGSVVAEAVDETAGVRVRSELRLDLHGVVHLRHTLTNVGTDVWTIAALRTVLPLPEQATEVLDFTGRWGLERVPQRRPLGNGTHARESRRGRTGHDATPLLVAGTPDFSEAWAVHIGWSGGHEEYAERISGTVAVLGGGELLEPGEVRLTPGQSYSTPTGYFVWSDAGLDGLSDRLHRMIRSRPSHPHGPRPLTLNVWEAVYFDHDLDRLTRLADLAARVGVERFVLDDGWFPGRRDDTAGLGDWTVDPVVWPSGLHPLVDHVRSRGMRFGLWFEPEMVNPDSSLARDHPEWILATPGRLPRPSRHQHVLDVARPEVADYLFDRISALVTEYELDYLKWDHNRDLLEAARDGVAGVHRQTAAVYALLDRLRARHPALEIESCASGGGRVDLGILARTDRVWASDSNDALDRQHIQRWTGLLLPPELIGSHVGPSPAHTTGRSAGLAFRCATALFGHAGIEWDISTCTEVELDLLAEWAALYKRLRVVLHSGRTVHGDVSGVVTDEAAVFVHAQLDNPTELRQRRLRLPGLHPERRYRVTRCWGADAELPDDGFITTGRALSTIGFQVPRLRPEQAIVFEVRGDE